MVHLLNFTTCPLPAHPTSAPATVTVNTFNTSLPAGYVLVNFTASTTDGNRVNFAISSLSASKNYTIKRDGTVYSTVQSDSSGTIRFNYSQWSSNRTFTVAQVVDYGNLSGIARNASGAPLIGAGVATGAYTAVTNSTGGYLFTNIPIGTYTVTASAAGYVNSSLSAQVTAQNTTILHFNLSRPEITGTVMDRGNGSPLPGSTVTLYYSNGTSTGLSNISGADGRFQFSNVAYGSYYVNVSRAGYLSNQSSVFNVTSDTDTGVLSLLNYDANGDGSKNILDLNIIVQRYGIIDASVINFVSSFFDVTK